MRRVVFILADGLRPDAITPSRMPSLHALGGTYTLALHATTVRPSTTVAALTSLATGLAPATHGFTEPGLGFLRRLAQLRPVARELGRAGHASHIVASEVNAVERSIATALAGAAGIARVTYQGRRAGDVAAAARELARAHTRGILFVYLNDCDRVGHEHGWMSDAYLAAAAEVDAGIGALAERVDDSLFIVAADHGGGGVTACDHGEPHPVNDRIPLVLAGPAVTRHHQLTRAVSILDLPPTLLWWFGLEVPPSYEGRVLTEAFVPAADQADAVAAA